MKLFTVKKRKDIKGSLVYWGKIMTYGTISLSVDIEYYELERKTIIWLYEKRMECRDLKLKRKRAEKNLHRFLVNRNVKKHFFVLLWDLSPRIHNRIWNVLFRCLDHDFITFVRHTDMCLPALRQSQLTNNVENELNVDLFSLLWLNYHIRKKKV